MSFSKDIELENIHYKYERLILLLSEFCRCLLLKLWKLRAHRQTVLQMLYLRLNLKCRIIMRNLKISYRKMGNKKIMTEIQLKIDAELWQALKIIYQLRKEGQVKDDEN